MITKRPAFIAFLFLSAIALHSCDEPDELGLGILPTSDKLSVFFSDTASIRTDVTDGDSVITSGILYAHLLGSFSDPQFGRSDASIYAQLGFSFNPVLGDDTETLTADSLVLTLEYNGLSSFATSYGNINTPMKFLVYRLTEALRTDTFYYSNRTFNTEPAPIGSATIIPAPFDSVLVYGKNTTPHLRIRLSDALASEILALNGTDTFSTTAAWKDYFKGLYIRTEPVNSPGEGSLLQINLNATFGTLSAMTLYYHSNTPDDDSLRYSFLFDGVRTNHYAHAYGTSDAGKQLQDSTYNSTQHYVQGLGGVRTVIDFPHIRDLVADGNIAVDKAEITIPAEESELYSAPSFLRLLAIDSAGRSYLPIDFINEPSFYGGGFNTTDKLYTFNITRQLQAMIDGRQQNNGFYLVVPFLAVTQTQYRMQPNRVIVSSSGNSARPVTLKVTYTKLD